MHPLVSFRISIVRVYDYPSVGDEKFKNLRGFMDTVAVPRCRGNFFMPVILQIFYSSFYAYEILA